MELAAIRKEYKLRTLELSDVQEDPVLQLEVWVKDAVVAQVNEPNAMTLSTLNSLGRPSSRVVLLKGIQEGKLVFFTNYDSQKGKEIENFPHVALNFHWAELERQVRVEGFAEKITPEASDAYFFSRPFGSQIGAWVSPQSKTIPNRAYLETKEQELRAKYQEGSIQRPPHWGGYAVTVDYMEFWQGRPSRLHDRIAYTLEEDSGLWTKSRLAP